MTQFTLRQQQKIDLAAQQAMFIHGDQKYGSFPYAVHLEQVFTCALERIDQLTDLDASEETFISVLQASWLHDSIERCPQLSLVPQFSGLTNDIVWCLTPKGENRREQLDNLVAGILSKTVHLSRPTVFIKMCDRYCNAKWAFLWRHQIFGMYQNEYRIFRRLKWKGEFEPFWVELDALFGFVV